MDQHRRCTAIITWVGRFSGSLSMLGSSLLIYMIISRRKRKLKKPKNRLMLMMSIFDILHSSMFLVGTLAVPVESGVYGAMGNHSTCIAQGMLAWFGLAVPVYNNSLNLYYLLTIRYHMDSAHFSKKYEPICHIVSILGPLSTGITFACLGWIGVELPMGTMCFVDDEVVFILGILFMATFIFLISTMATITFTVSTQSNMMSRYIFGSTKTRHRTNCEKETITQAWLYSLAFIITFISPGIEILLVLIGIPVAPCFLRILTSALLPMQGFWNCLFYIRPGVKYARQRNPDKSLKWAVWEVISNSGSGSAPNEMSNISSSRTANALHSSNTRLQTLTSRALQDNINRNLRGVEIDDIDDVNTQIAYPNHNVHHPGLEKDYVDANTDLEACPEELKNVKVDDRHDQSKKSSSLTQKSVNITSQNMNKLYAKDLGSSFHSCEFLNPIELVKTEESSCSTIDGPERQDGIYCSTVNELKTNENYVTDNESCRDEGRQHHHVIQQKVRKAKRRLSLVSIASVMSDMSIDSV